MGRRSLAWLTWVAVVNGQQNDKPTAGAILDLPDRASDTRSGESAAVSRLQNHKSWVLRGLLISERR